MTKKAFITGITGQDGSYLAEILLEKNYIVHGTVRRSSSINTSRIDHLISKHLKSDRFNLHYSDLLDATSVINLINLIQPDEIYNLGAQSHVAVSFKNPMYSTQTGTTGIVPLLECIKNSDKEIKFYQASSSEMYGGKSNLSLNENSEFDPRSPYAASKVFAHNMTKIYRDSYDLFCSNGILFNHESPRRGETFVTKKITMAVARIHLGLQNKLTLGNLDASRDWGYAKDYVEAMYLIMQNNYPDDWVIATGKTYTVKEFLKKAFDYVNLNWEDFVQTSKDYYRPNEVDFLLGDPGKAKKILGWEPKTNIDELVKIMVEHDLETAKREKVLFENGMLKPTWENPNV